MSTAKGHQRAHVAPNPMTHKAKPVSPASKVARNPGAGGNVLSQGTRLGRR